MSQAASFWFIVPAAGAGRRMGSDKPKQYLQLQGKTILDHTLSRLLSVDLLAGIILALDEQDIEFTNSIYAKHEKIHRVTGGKERADSVLAGLHFLADKAVQQDWILVHDAARPCVTNECISLLQSRLANDPVGGILAVPVVDTIKRVDTQTIVQTIDRSTLWQAQTPQMFRYGVLYKALYEAIDRKQAITDEASAIELAGLPAKIIEGSTDNIKITRPADLDLAAYILKKQEKN